MLAISSPYLQHIFMPSLYLHIFSRHIFTMSSLYIYHIFTRFLHIVTIPPSYLHHIFTGFFTRFSPIFTRVRHISIVSSPCWPPYLYHTFTQFSPYLHRIAIFHHLFIISYLLYTFTTYAPCPHNTLTISSPNVHHIFIICLITRYSADFHHIFIRSSFYHRQIFTISSPEFHSIFTFLSP